MTSSSDTFPFGIADVVELLGLSVRRRLPSSLYLNCPFCGDQRGRLNVNTDKNVWRCNRYVSCSIPKKQNGRYSQDTLLWTLILYGRSPGMNRISPTCAEDGR